MSASGTFNGTVGVAASWSVSETISYTVTKAALTDVNGLPPGMTASASYSTNKLTSVISGTPTTAGTYNVEITIEYLYKSGPFTFPATTIHTFFVSIVSPSYTHTIYYNANGGTGTMAATSVTDYNSGNTNVTSAYNSFTAPAGRYFIGWWYNGGLYGAGTTFAVGANSSITLYAGWSYIVSLGVDPTGTGSVIGTGSYTYNASVTISAIPADHYHFVNWSDGSTEASRTLIITGDVSLTANFAIDTHTISTAVSPTGTGSVTGGGTYNYGASATLTATAVSRYVFEKWNDNSTTNPRTVTVTGDVTYTAYFKLERPPISVKVNGSWVQGTTYVKINGSWVQAIKIWINDNGTWKESK